MTIKLQKWTRICGIGKIKEVFQRYKIAVMGFRTSFHIFKWSNSYAFKFSICNACLDHNEQLLLVCVWLIYIGISSKYQSPRKHFLTTNLKIISCLKQKQVEKNDKANLSFTLFAFVKLFNLFNETLFFQEWENFAFDVTSITAEEWTSWNKIKKNWIFLFIVNLSDVCICCFLSFSIKTNSLRVFTLKKFTFVYFAFHWHRQNKRLVFEINWNIFQVLVLSIFDELYF